MEDWMDDVTLVGFVDDMGNALFYAEKHNFGAQTMTDLNEVHDSLIDLGPLVQSEADLDTMKDLMGSAIDDLNAACIAGGEPATQEKIASAMAAINSVKSTLKK